MKVAGLSVRLYSTEEIEFRKTSTLIDYDIVFWNCAYSLSEYNIIRSGTAIPALQYPDSTKIKEDFKRRNEEFSEFFELGRLLVLFAPFPIKLEDDTGYFNLIEYLPIKAYSANQVTGSSIVQGQSKILDSFFKKSLSYFKYNAHFTFPGEPLLYIKDTKKIVSAYSTYGKGHILILPDLKNDLTKDQQHDIVNEITEFYQKLTSLPASRALPGWTNSYKLPNEVILNNELDKYYEELNSISSKIEQQKIKMDLLKRRKILFAGGDEDLEMEVKTLFEQLGFQLHKTEKNRDDLNISYGEKTAVVEIKGVTKSASEKQAAQLEKWISEYKIEKDIRPKGILIVNAYKNTHLEAEANQSFLIKCLHIHKRESIA